jgi:hypothetical protein
VLKKILIVSIISTLVLSAVVFAQRGSTTFTFGTTTSGKTTTTTTSRGTTTFGTTTSPTTTTTSPTTTTLLPPGPSQFTQPLPNAPVSAGSILNMHGSDPSLNDIKGQPVIGVSTGGGITGYWGAGYHLWLAGGPTDWVPLTIERDPGTPHIKVSWDPAAYPNPDIYFKSGSFTNIPGDWTYLDPALYPGGGVDDVFNFTTYSSGFFLFLTQIGQGDGAFVQAYFRGLSQGTDPAGIYPDGVTYIASAQAVGKFDYAIGPNYTLITQVFEPQTGDFETWELSPLFSNQITDGDIQYADPGLLRAACVSGVWDSASVKISEGFWIKSSASGVLTLMGRVIDEDFEKTIVQGYDLYGYPYPKTIDITQGSSVNLGIDPPIDGDEVQMLVGGGLLRYVHGASGWDANFLVGMGKGYWYSNPSAATRYFRVNLP